MIKGTMGNSGVIPTKKAIRGVAIPMMTPEMVPTVNALIIKTKFTSGPTAG